MKYKSVETGRIIDLVRVDFDMDGKYAVYDQKDEKTGISNRYKCDFEIFKERYSKIEANGTEPPEYPEGTIRSENGLYTIKEPSKPAHYDTAIDTIAFAKANFSREQVEGFMRINAVKYIQRYKAKNGVDDVRKAVVYLNMLIEHLEEEEK